MPRIDEVLQEGCAARAGATPDRTEEDLERGNALVHARVLDLQEEGGGLALTLRGEQEAQRAIGPRQRVEEVSALRARAPRDGPVAEQELHPAAPVEQVAVHVRAALERRAHNCAAHRDVLHSPQPLRASDEGWRMVGGDGMWNSIKGVPRLRNSIMRLSGLDDACGH
jgi:hypothetical protein